MLLRSRSAALALAGFITIGALAVVTGQRYVAQWEEALATAEAAQQSLITETRGYFERGEPGPADRPWVDLGQPLWQDWYSGTRVARLPGALAGIAAGAVDSAPAVFRVNRLADPLAAGGYRIENPELAVGAVDMVIVIGLLLPLLVGVLGLNIGSWERESRLDRQITVQAGALFPWLLARTLAVALIAGGAVTVLCLVSALLGGASTLETGAFVLTAWLYTALWSGLLLLVNARAKTLKSAAFGFGALWTLLCILLPTVSAELALARVQQDYALSETLDARGLRYDSYDLEMNAVLPALYDRYPTLRDRPAAKAEELPPVASRHAYDGLMFIALESRNAGRLAQEQSARRVATFSAWLSPAVAFALALERLAGVGPDAASDYRTHLVAAVLARGEWLLEKAWDQEPLDQQDYEALIADASAGFSASTRNLTVPLLALAGWTVFAWSFALLLLARPPDEAGVQADTSALSATASSTS